MILSDGSVLEGETDENGFTETALSAKQLKIDSIDYSDE
jgi:type VI secretion system secreted protein VgrG